MRELKKGAEMTVRMAVPNKGRLNERTIELMTKAGIALGPDWGRRLEVDVPSMNLQVFFLRAQDIPVFIASGSVDFGVTGQDGEAEAGTGLDMVLPLEFGHCRLSIAAPEDSAVAKGEMKDGIRIATSFPKLTEGFLKKKGLKGQVVFVQGAAEIMPQLGVSDAIADLVATGSTLRMNHLAEVETIMESQACIFASSSALKDSSKKGTIDSIVAAFRSVIRAEGKKYLMADVPVSKLSEVERIVPGIGGPTIIPIGDTGFAAVQVVVSAADVFRAVADLERIGAKGILTMPIERLVE